MEASHQATTIALEQEGDRAQVDTLIDAAFGPGRFAKTAERLREGNRPRRDLSCCVWLEGEMIAAVRQWPIRIGETPAVFLGPIAIASRFRGQGHGRALVRHVCGLARESGERLVLLVGDAAYFQPLGFVAVGPGRVLMPGPVDPGRLHWMCLRPLALEGASGVAEPAPRRSSEP